mgnify:CR=1 FL=1
MASRRKLPLVLFLITLVLLAGAVVLLLRGRPVTLERIAARQGYAITGQEEATVTLTLSREQMPKGFPEEVPISQAEGELKLPLLQDGDTFYLTAFARSDEDPGTLYAVIQPEHQLSREGGQLLLPYRIDEDGGITAQLRVSDLPVQADGEDRPDATRLASQGPGEQFALYVDRALFLRSDAITIQLGSFYRLTYAPA